MGIKLDGTLIDHVIVGGPAYNSKQISRGDTVLKVNDIPVTKSNIYELLLGDDVPGSFVDIMVSKGGLQVVHLFLLLSLLVEIIQHGGRLAFLRSWLRYGSHAWRLQKSRTAGKCWRCSLF